MGCKDCADRKICKKPCEWLNKELAKVTKGKEYLTFSEIGIDERTIWGIDRPQKIKPDVCR